MTGAGLQFDGIGDCEKNSNQKCFISARKFFFPSSLSYAPYKLKTKACTVNPNIAAVSSAP